jgi:hypothetical protein
VELDQALATIAAAKRMLEGVEARSPGSRTLRARRALAAGKLEELGRPGDRTEAGRAYVELMALERFLDTRFRNSKKARAADEA